MKVATSHHVVNIANTEHHHGRRKCCERHGGRTTSWYCWLVTVAACCPLLLTSCLWWLYQSESHILGRPSSSHSNLTLRTRTDDSSKGPLEENPCHGKEHLFKIVQLAGGADLSNDVTRRIVCDKMPLWSAVTKLYGDKPRIIGLDTCQRYRDLLAEANKTSSGVPIFAMPRVAGLHNSGTNALADTFFDNFVANPTIRSQNPRVYNIPWRKHTPLQYRLNVTARFYDWHEDKSHVLPVVVIRGALLILSHGLYCRDLRWNHN